MPSYKSHLMGAIGAWGAALGIIVFSGISLFTSYSYTQIAEWGLCALIGGLFPDLDTKSIGQQWAYKLLFVIACILFYLQCYYALSLVLLIACIPLIVKHRGIFHRLWFLALVSVLCAGMLSCMFPDYHTRIVSDSIFFFLGAFSHIILDYLI